ncbi:MAG: hypothetical protein HYR84_00685 [Planctomycetes bacterium]|nr:hypothetical protein [Planctomycetota bacterium]
MPESMKYLIDAGAAAGLFVALLIVFAVDWFISGPQKNTLENVSVKDSKSAMKKLKLAVVKTKDYVDPLTRKKEKYDDMGKLLAKLGDGYQFDEIDTPDLARLHEANTLKEYNVVFLTCNDAIHDNVIADPIRQYVADGGILYASDLRYTALAKAFPHLVDKQLIDEGAKQKLDAEIVDEALREAMGTDSIRLDFNLDQWRPAAFQGADVLMKGSYRPLNGGAMRSAPLMVRFPFGRNNGNVIFTSFHNEGQNSDLEVKLLRYLVFSLVTDSIDAELNSSMAKEGFDSKGANLLSTPKEMTVKEYQNDRVCTLRFALGFRGEGYKLRFKIESPSGKVFSHVCEGTTTLEVPDAEKGKWKYTVERMTAPDNLAFRMIVREKR